MATRVNNPFDLFTDTDGTPLESGHIYIGVANLNPITDPQNVFWDAGLTIPAAQPVRTIGGFPAYNGAPSRLYSADVYSILVQDKQKRLVFSDLNASVYLASDLLVQLKTVDGAGSGLVAEGVQSSQITDLNFDPALLGLAVRETRIYTTASGPLNQPPGVPASTFYTLTLTQPNAGEYRVVLIPGGTVGEIYTRTYSGAAWGSWSSTGGGAPLALAAVASPYTQIAGAAPMTYLVTTGASNFTFNLASAASQIGRRVTIVKIDSDVGELNVVPNGTDTVGVSGNTTVPIPFQGQSLSLIATATGWVEVSNSIAVDFRDTLGGARNEVLKPIPVGRSVFMHWHMRGNASVSVNVNLPAGGSYAVSIGGPPTAAVNTQTGGTNTSQTSTGVIAGGSSIVNVPLTLALGRTLSGIITRVS